MKNYLKASLESVLAELQKKHILPADLSTHVQLERTRDKKLGHFSSNIAMVLAKAAGHNPRQLAELVLAYLPSIKFIKKVVIAGPGFINFFLTVEAFQTIIPHILGLGAAYGLSTIGNNEKIHLEFVSSNPNGPLHVGHGRSAAYGAALGDILTAAGFVVHREYYVNDAGRQMHILAVSVWLRYLTINGEALDFPSNGYRGAYVLDIAHVLQEQYGQRFKHAAKIVFDAIAADETATGGDKDAHIDDLIERAKKLLGKVDYQLIFDCALTMMLKNINQDLAAFGVHYQEWFSELQLATSGTIERAIEKLRSANYLYEKEGAVWFRSTALGDDKDRVVIRENGQTTYFASDIAYFLSKQERGFKKMILVVGADHHGYIPRLKAALQALDLDPVDLKMPLVQLAVLYRGNERIPMSTRQGSFVTLQELCNEVGKDAARFFYVWRKCEQPMDFDLELAKSQSADNPVYYIQYAYARICSVFRQLADKQLDWDKAQALANLTTLVSEHEIQVLMVLSQYSEIIETAAINYEPHLLAHYLRDLANSFHGYYNACQFIVDDKVLRNARLALIAATQQVLHNGLRLLGVNTPESM